MIIKKIFFVIISLLSLLLSANVSAAPPNTTGVGDGSTLAKAWGFNTYSINGASGDGGNSSNQQLWFDGAGGTYANLYFSLNTNQGHVFDYYIPGGWLIYSGIPARIVMDQIWVFTNNSIANYQSFGGSPPSGLPAGLLSAGPNYYQTLPDVVYVGNNQWATEYLFAVTNSTYTGTVGSGKPSYVGIPYNSSSGLSTNVNSSPPPYTLINAEYDSPVKQGYGLGNFLNFQGWAGVNNMRDSFGSTSNASFGDGNGPIITPSGGGPYYYVQSDYQAHGQNLYIPNTSNTMLVTTVLQGDSTISGNMVMWGINMPLVLNVRVWDGGGTIANCYFAPVKNAGGTYNPVINIIAENNKKIDLTNYYSAGNAAMAWGSGTASNLRFINSTITDANVYLQTIPDSTTLSLGSYTNINKNLKFYNSCGFVTYADNNVTGNISAGTNFTMTMNGWAARATNITGIVDAGNSSNITLAVAPGGGWGTNNTCSISGVVTVGNGSTVSLNDSTYLGSTLSTSLNGSLNLNLNASSYIVGAVNTGSGALTLNMNISDNAYTKGLQSTVTAGNSSSVLMQNYSPISGTVTLGSGSTVTMQDNSWMKSTLSTSGNGSLTLTMNNNISSSALISGAVTTGSGQLILNMAITDNSYTNGIQNTVSSSFAGNFAANYTSVLMTNNSPISGLVTLGTTSLTVMKDNSRMSNGLTVGDGSVVWMQDSSYLPNAGAKLQTSANGSLTLNMYNDNNAADNGKIYYNTNATVASLINGPVTSGSGVLTLTMKITDNTFTKGIQNTVIGGNSSTVLMTNNSPIKDLVTLGTTSLAVMKDSSRMSNGLTVGGGSTVWMQDSSYLSNAGAKLQTAANGNLTLNMYNDNNGADSGQIYYNTNATVASLINGQVTTGSGVLSLTMKITDNTYTKGIQNTVTGGNSSTILMTNNSPISGLVTLGTTSLTVMKDNSQMSNGLTVGGGTTVWMQDSSSLSNVGAKLQTAANGNLTLNMYNDSNGADSGQIYYNINATVASLIAGQVTTGTGVLTLTMKTTDNTYTKGIQNTVIGGDNSVITMSNYSPINGLVTLGNVATVNMSNNSLMNNGMNTGGSVGGVAGTAPYTQISLSNFSKIHNDVTIAAEGSTNATDLVVNYRMKDNTILNGNITVDKYNILSLNGSAQVTGNISGNLNGASGVGVDLWLGDVSPINYVSQGQIDYMEKIVIYSSSSLTLNYAVTGTKSIIMYPTSTLNVNVDMTADVTGIGVGTNRIMNVGPNAPTILQSAGVVSGIDYINVYGGSTFNAINGINLSTQFYVYKGGNANIEGGIAGATSILNNGNLTLSSDAYIRGTIVSQPVDASSHSSLTIQGNIQTEATALTVKDVFSFSVTDATHYDSIYVAGPIDMSQANFNATVNFVPLWTDSIKFVIARGRGADAKVPPTAVLPNVNTLFFNFSIYGDGPDVVLEYARRGFGDVATEPYQKQIGYALDALSLSPLITADEKALIQLVAESTTVAQHDKVMNQLMSINTVPVTDVTLPNQTFQQISWRMAQNSMKQTHYSAGILGPDYSLWIKPFYSHSRQKANSEMVSFKTRSQGIVIGLDNNSDTLDTIGVAAAVVQDQLKGYAGYNAYAKTNSYELLTYGQYTVNSDYYWEWIGMFSLKVTDQKRNISFQTFNKTAESNYTWLHAAGKVGIGHDYDFNDYTIWNNVWHWKADAMYAFSYQETGAGPAGLQVKPQNIISLETGLTSKLSYALEIYDIQFINSVEVGGTYKVINPKFTTSCKFVMGGGEQFQISMKQPRVSWTAGADLQINLTDSASFGINYRYEFNHAYRNHLLDLSFRLNF